MIYFFTRKWKWCRNSRRVNLTTRFIKNRIEMMRFITLESFIYVKYLFNINNVVSSEMRRYSILTGLSHGKWYMRNIIVEIFPPITNLKYTLVYFNLPILRVYFKPLSF